MKTRWKTRRINIAACMLMLFSAHLHAAPELSAPTDLPPLAAVEATLDAYPGVLAARARVAAALAESRRINAGEYEYQARAGYARRRESGNIGGTLASNDWEIGIERGLRLPGKAKLDAATGATLVAEAEERVGEARHEAARDLLSIWYAALRAKSAGLAWRDQIGVLRQQREAVAKRIKAGDAARMEQSLAEAAVLQAEAEARRAEAAEAQAVASLAARFPGLPAPAAQSGRLPVLSGDAGEWVRAALEHNHELAILQQSLERMRVLTRRQRAELTPDPTLGLHFARERDGQDNLLGVSLTLPLPGEGRRARVNVANEEARALAQIEVATRTRIESGIRDTHARLQGALSRLEAQEAMALQLDEYAELAWRAYRLGETALWETLNARKSARDAHREVMASRLDAHEAAALLLLDSHRLWPFVGEHAANP
jgi:outer membrane protein TolC